MLSGLDGERALRALELTGPKAPMMAVVQINHLGGALAVEPAVPTAVPYRDAAFLLRPLSPLEGTGVAAVRALYAQVSSVLEPLTVGRSLNFSFGGGDRTGGLHDERTRKRLAGVVSQYDPASLFGGVYEGQCPSRCQPRRPTSFQAVGSAPIASAAFSASPSRNGTRPAAIAALADIPVESARYGTPTA